MEFCEASLVDGHVPRQHLLCACLGAITACATVPDVDLAITNVHVIPMDTTEVLRDQTILIAGDQIVAITPNEDAHIPANVITHDAAGEQQDAWGSLRAGQAADVVLLARNPLVDIEHVADVLVGWVGS